MIRPVDEALVEIVDAHLNCSLSVDYSVADTMVFAVLCAVVAHCLDLNFYVKIPVDFVPESTIAGFSTPTHWVYYLCGCILRQFKYDSITFCIPFCISLHILRLSQYFAQTPNG